MKKGHYDIGTRVDGRICQMWVQTAPRPAEFWTGKIYASMEDGRFDVGRLNDSAAPPPAELVPARDLARQIATAHGGEACDHIENGDLEAAYRAARLAAHVALDV